VFFSGSYYFALEMKTCANSLVKTHWGVPLPQPALTPTLFLGGRWRPGALLCAGLPQASAAEAAGGNKQRWLLASSCVRGLRHSQLMLFKIEQVM